LAKPPWITPALRGRRAGASVAPVSIRFAYALILTVSGAALNLVLYFTGWQTDKLATGHYFMWLQEVIMVVVLWRGIKAVRAESPGHGLSYGRGVVSGVLISLYSGLMSGVYNAVHFKFVNAHFADYQVACFRPDWSASRMSAADLAQAEKITRLLVTPTAQLILTPIITVGIGLVLSLVIAAFLRRPFFDGTSPPFRAN